MTDFLKTFSEWLVYSILGLAPGTELGETLDFFIYDTIKILILLFVMIFIMGVLRTYVSREKVRNLLSERRGILGNVAASAFGVITPFCSCSSIPIFMGFLEAGVPLGVALSFLITSPLVNEYLLVLMFGFFGWEIAVAYLLLGMTLGVFLGALIGRMGMQKYLVPGVFSEKPWDQKIKTFSHRLGFGLNEAKSIVGKLWMWIILGVALGAVIHGYVPAELIKSVMESTGIFAVPLAVLAGIPMYANCSAVVPLAAVLFEKGVPLGTVLAFMMAASALSFPEAVILRRVMKIRLLLVFFGMVGLGIIVIGYLMNFLF